MRIIGYTSTIWRDGADRRRLLSSSTTGDRDQNILPTATTQRRCRGLNGTRQVAYVYRDHAHWSPLFPFVMPDVSAAIPPNSG